MMFKSIYILLILTITAASCSSSNNICGSYKSDHSELIIQNRAAVLVLNEDSTFQYTQCIGMCWRHAEYKSQGKWKLANNILLLSSYLQPNDSLAKQYDSDYKYFTNCRFIINGKSLVDTSQNIKAIQKLRKISSRANSDYLCP
jgi:hypothetical protein